MPDCPNTTVECLAKTVDTMNTSKPTTKQSASRSDKSLCATQPPVDSTALWRFIIAAWIVLALTVAAFSFIFRYGDAPRPIVEWLTAYVLAPMVAVMFTIMGYAMLRFGRACRKYAAQNVQHQQFR